ncbi:MAG: class I SAM-dependent methyltransferase [Gammaproteobacteria bacterium]|nr:class I SAM-dependent methyltransferase [Pseudomonadales bacterium]MCP5349128.1 class I SAM-dependent methyltransferase [Pseudomonadales bacterium]
MKPRVLGTRYDRIADWWHRHHQDSQYGVAQVRRALQFCKPGGSALDVGCGAGGRIVRLLQQHQLAVTGIDVSVEMIKLAIENHPQEVFAVEDICQYSSAEHYDFIVAWDSIFHLPLKEQEPVIGKLCALLKPGGVLIYTCGDAVGEHQDTWHGQTFHYSSIGITGNLSLLARHGVVCKHLELDQWPQNHVTVIGLKETEQ